MITIIKVLTDPACEMAAVYLNDELVMEGNYWDFHPGCHGINKYGDFNSYAGLAHRLFLWLIKNYPKDVVEIKKENYKYDDE